MKLNKDQRKVLSKYLSTLSAITYASLIIGQLLSKVKFNILIFIAGVFVATFFLILALYTRK